MDQENRKIGVIILEIKGGRGFGFLETPMYIKATLNKSTLKTKSILPSVEPTIDAQLSWETETKAIRRLRIGNVPIRVECFTQTGTRLGYILLVLRGAQLVRNGDDVKLKDKWHKLLDASFCKPDKPELLINLRIEELGNRAEHLEAIPSDCTVKDNVGRLSSPNSDTDIHTENDSQENGKRLCPYTPELCQDEGVIQIGPKDTATDIFHFTIYVGKSGNLDLLVPDSRQQNSTDFYFCCNVMGFTIQASRISDLSHCTSTTDEKVNVRIRSSLKILQQYFNDVSVLTVWFMCGQKEIAFSEIDVTVLVPTDNLFDFCNHYAVHNTLSNKKKCILTLSKTGAVPQQLDGSKPYVDIEVTLRYIGESGDSFLPADSVDEVPQPPYEGLSEDVATADRRSFHSLPNSASLMNFPQEELKNEYLTGMSDLLTTPWDMLNKSLVPEEISQTVVMEDGSTIPYHVYCLQIMLLEIVFHKYPLQKDFFFIFNHSKAEVMPTAHTEMSITELNKTIHLQGIKCKMKFETSIQNIDQQLLNEPPTVSVYYNLDGENIKFSEAQLDISLLSLKREKHCVVPSPLMSVDDNSIVGILTLSMSLKDYGLELPKDVTEKQLFIENEINPFLFNDKVAMKVVKELEDWKERQKESFKNQLQRKENQYLSALSANWESKRKEFETALNKNMQKCFTLAQSLEDSAKELRAKSLKVDEKQLELNIFEQKLQKEHSFQIQELKELLRRTEDDLKLKISQLQLEKDDILKKNDSLETENKKMKEELSRLNDLIKSFTSCGQTSNVAEELKAMEAKYQHALRTKTFFKEQWARSVRELHRIKTEHQKEIQIQIQHNKEELRALGLEHLLNGEKAELKKDEEILQQLRHTFMKSPSTTFKVRDDPNNLQHGYPTSSYLSGTMSTPALHTTVPHKLPHSGNERHMICQQEDVQQEVTRLVDEVDTLLRTGSYSKDDPIIVSLSNEIKNLQVQQNVTV